jgi:hypothetical protein
VPARADDLVELRDDREVCDRRRGADDPLARTEDRLEIAAAKAPAPGALVIEPGAMSG